jgi:ABC-type transport system substrate-binding protein
LSQGIVAAELKLLEANAIDAARANRAFSYALFGHSTGMVDPDIWLSTTYHSTGSLNFAGFKDSQADALIDKQRAIFDERPRKATVKETLLYLIDHSPYAIGANPYMLQGVRPRVQGFSPEYYLNGRQYQAVWLDT